MKLKELLVNFDCETLMELEHQLWEEVGVNYESHVNGFTLTTTNGYSKTFVWGNFNIHDIDKALEEAEDSYISHPIGVSC